MNLPYLAALSCALFLIIPGDARRVLMDSAGPTLAKKPVKKKGKLPLHEHPTLVKMLAKNNALRKEVGLKPQKMSAELTKAAQDHAWYMARTGDFSHYGNHGHQARAKKHGFRGMALENIAMGYQTVDIAFAGWQSSGPHWASITSDAPLAGFGFARSEDGTSYWVGVYGYPAKKK
jgi:uncharacterized protein YkwD